MPRVCAVFFDSDLIFGKESLLPVSGVTEFHFVLIKGQFVGPGDLLTTVHRMSARYYFSISRCSSVLGVPIPSHIEEDMSYITFVATALIRVSIEAAVKA